MQKPAGCDCASKKVRDSLAEKYLDNGAEQHSYNTPAWQMYCDSLIAICPNIGAAYQHKAIPFIKYGTYEKAFELEDKAAALEPNLFTAYRGFLKCIFLKDYEGAIVDFENAQQLTPNSYEMDHTYFFYLGLCHLELRHFALAAHNLQQDVRVQTGGDTTKSYHFNTAFYLGVLQYEMKDYSLAKYYLLKCIAVYPQHPLANYYLALVYRQMKDDRLADNYLQLSKQFFEKGYGINEDNLYYANYPHQVRLYEVEQAITHAK